jgi:hypothetical protein
MARNYSPARPIVIGFFPYEKKKGFLNYFIQLITFNTALNYLSFAFAACHLWVSDVI